MNNRTISRHFSRDDAIITFQSIIIGIGIFLRLRQYLFNRSFWLDEAILAANFIHKNWGQLLHAPMDYTESMIAPAGFMLMAKTAITLFGNSDIMLRLYPFLCSVIALPLFMKLAQYFVSKTGGLAALFIFSVSGPLIYYASEFKQYSSDVFFAIVILLIFQFAEESPITIKRMITLATLGALCIWFSFPSPFLLAPIGIYLAWQYGKEKQWRDVVILAIVSLIWLLSFWAQYRIVNGTGLPLTRPWIIDYWANKQAFMPSPLSQDGLHWMWYNFTEIFKSVGDWRIMEIPMIFFLIGIGTMFYSSKARRLFVLLAPLGLTVAASYFRLYPFNGRMLLFSLPAVILIIGEGIAQIFAFRLPIKKESFLAATAMKIVLFGICLVATGTMINSKLVSHDEIKPVFEYVQTRQKEGDKIYLYYWAEPAFRYYAPFYGFNFAECKPIAAAPTRKIMDPIEYFRNMQNITPAALEDTHCILGIAGSAGEATPEFEQLKGAGRIWFIFSFFGGDDFIQPLDQIGTQLDKLILFGASAYLYEL